MSGTITLRGVKISSAALYRRYFRFGEVLRLLKKDAYTFRAFYRSAFPLSVSTDLFGLYDAEGNPRPGAPAALLENPEACTELACGWLFRRPEGQAWVTADLENLVSHFATLYQRYAGDPEADAIYKTCPAPEPFQADLRRVLTRLTQDGARTFPCEGAAELYLFCLLHIQAGLLVGSDRKALAELEADLERLCPVSADTLRQAREISFQEQLELPFYQGAERLPGPLELVCLRNSGPGQGRVTLRGAVLTRVLEPNAYLFALRTGGEYVSFLPRAALVGRTVLKLENDRLCTVLGDDTRYLNTRVSEPVCWAHSNEYGTFILDREGRLDEDAAWPDAVPAKPIVSVAAFGDQYCLLLADGSVSGWPARPAWTEVLNVSVGLNAAVALDAGRRPVLPDGDRKSVV